MKIALKYLKKSTKFEIANAFSGTHRLLSMLLYTRVSEISMYISSDLIKTVAIPLVKNVQVILQIKATTDQFL